MPTSLSRAPSPSTSLASKRWESLESRDASVPFVYGVKTTGLYARPGDHAKLPLRANVEFFDNEEQAVAAGYRSSAQGDRAVADRHAAIVARACILLASSSDDVNLTSLAAAVQLSPHHLHRVFKRVTGLTPKAYGVALRAQKVREGLAAQDSVTRALYDAGFNASSRFYEASDGMLGMKPRTYRDKGAQETIHFAIGQCSLGAILVAQSDKGVCAILLGDDPSVLANNLQDRFSNATLVGADADFEQTVARVVGFIEAPGLGLQLPLDIRGTAFQHRVWLALQQVAPGTTVSYAQLAQRIGCPTAVRAIAGACAANPLAVAVPCHRVIRQDGGLSGYRWGVERKRALLDRESTNA